MSTYNVNYNKVSLSQWNVRISIEEVTLMQKKHEIMKQYHTKYIVFKNTSEFWDKNLLIFVKYLEI